MTSRVYPFTIGRFRCQVLSDGYIAVPKTVPGPGEKAPENREFENMDISCLLISDGHTNILIDTGCGSAFQDTAGKLLENLKAIGVSPVDIDFIIYTHGHEDHVAGSFDKDGKAVFGKARYVLSKKEWASMEQKPETPLNSGLFGSARKYLLPLKDRVILTDDNQEVFPGIVMQPAKGHTLGGVIIRIGGEDGIHCIGDLIHSFSEFDDPDGYAFLDAAPKEARLLRTDGLAKMSKESRRLFACHFPFPGIGVIKENKGRLGWLPVDIK